LCFNQNHKDNTFQTYNLPEQGSLDGLKKYTYINMHNTTPTMNKTESVKMIEKHTLENILNSESKHNHHQDNTITTDKLHLDKQAMIQVLKQEIWFIESIRLGVTLEEHHEQFLRKIIIFNESLLESLQKDDSIIKPDALEKMDSLPFSRYKELDNIVKRETSMIEFMLHIMSQGMSCIPYIVKSDYYGILLENKEFITRAAPYESTILYYIHESLVMDTKYILSLLYKQPTLFRYAKKSIIEDKRIVLPLVQMDGLLIQYASKRLRNNKIVAEAAVKQNPRAFQFVGPHWRNTVSFARHVIEQDPIQLKYAGNKLKKNKQLILGMMKQDFDTWKALGTPLIYEEDVAIQALKRDGLLLGETYCNSRTKRLVLIAVKQNGLALQDTWYYKEKNYINDREITFEAIKQNGYALQYAKHDFKSNKELIMLAYRNTRDFEFIKKNIMPDLYNDRYFLLSLELEHSRVYTTKHNRFCNIIIKYIS
jgi:hypothetical protein